MRRPPTVRPRPHDTVVHYIVCYSEQYVRLKRNVFRPHLLLFLAAFSIDQQCCVAFDQYNQDVHHVQLTFAVTACAAYIEDSAVIICHYVLGLPTLDLGIPGRPPSLPVPSLPSLLFPSSPSFHSPWAPPLNQLGGLGRDVSSPVGLGQSPSRQTIWSIYLSQKEQL